MIEFIFGFVAATAFWNLYWYYGFFKPIRSLVDEYRQMLPTPVTSTEDIYDWLEPIEREQTAPETLVLEVLSDNKDTPVTYKQLDDLIEPLNENDIRNAIGSLESKGKVEVSSAGNLGNYYEVQEIGEVNSE